MNLRERFSWIAWSWGICLLSLRLAGRRRRRLRDRLSGRVKKKARRRLVDAAAAMQAAR